jgi:hypothetical protein
VVGLWLERWGDWLACSLADSISRGLNLRLLIWVFYQVECMDMFRKLWRDMPGEADALDNWAGK